MYDLILKLYELVDWGGVLTLIVTVIIIWRSKVYEDIKNKLNETDPLWRIVILVLALIGLTALWLTVRDISLFVKRYILEERYSYAQTNIFEMLGYILTTNLCFTLLRTFTMMAKSKQENTTTTTSKNVKPINELINVAIQAVIIGFITFVPRYGDKELLETIGKSTGYMFIIVSMMVAIVVLAFLRERFSSIA